MAVDMFLWVPVATVADPSGAIPDITVQCEALARGVTESKKISEATDDGLNDRERRKKAAKPLKEIHDGWVDVLAWSHGVSKGSSTRRRHGGEGLQDISLTKWQDSLSPAMYIMVMRGEIIPNAILRIVAQPKDDKVKITEYTFFNARITSLSTGGSGGENRLTENVSMAFSSFKLRMCEVDLITGDISSESSGFWDDVAEEGVRDGLQSVPQLKMTLRNYICEHTSLFHPKELVSLVRADLISAEELGISPNFGVVPPKGRRFVVSKLNLNAAAGEVRRYQEIFVKTITMSALSGVIAERLKVATTAVGDIYYLDDKDRLIQLASDEQFADLPEDTSLIVEIN